MTVRDYSAPWRSVSRITLRRLVQRGVLPARPIDLLLSSCRRVSETPLKVRGTYSARALEIRPLFVDDFGDALNSHRIHFGR